MAAKGNGTVISEATPSDATEAPPARTTSGVESGPEWIPPADPSKASKLPQLTGERIKSPDQDWTVPQIRTALQALTGGIDIVAGDSVGASITMTRSEADAVAEPLTNIINRNPALRAMSNASDVVTLALATVPWLMRLGGEAIETRRKRAEAGIDIDAIPADAMAMGA